MTSYEPHKPIDYQALGKALMEANVNYRDVMVGCGCSQPIAYQVLYGEWNPENPRHSMVIGLIRLAQQNDIEIPYKD